MSTSKEETLQIKDFRGVNRFADGTVTPPNEAWTFQNYHPISRGEIQSLKGVVEKAASLSGVTTILRSSFLNPTNGDKKLICFYEPSFDTWPSVPNITASNLVTSGGSGVSCNIQFVYVGPGGAYITKTVSAFSIQADGMTFTLPVGIPSYVAAIDVYASPTVGGFDEYPWLGTISRRNGVFPASAILLFNPLAAFAATPATTPEAVPNVFNAVPAINGGSLVPNRLYYFAVAPWVISSFPATASFRHTRAYLSKDAGATFFTATLPKGYDSFVLSFGWAASPAVAAGTNVSAWVLFIGSSPEDMQAVCNRTDGTVTYMSDTDVRSNGVVIKEVPTNNRNHISMVSQTTYDQGGATQDASSGRDYGNFINISSPVVAETFVNSYNIGAWVFPSLTDFTQAYQLLPHALEMSFCKTATNGHPEIPQFTRFRRLDKDEAVYTQQYANRLYCANNENTPFYTNGYVFKPIVRSDGVHYIPITKHIGLVKDQIILGGGDNSYANFSGGFFYSTVANPNAFGGVSPAWNFLPVNSGDDSGINGFGTYSSDLSAVGPRTFLIISKDDSTFSWNGIPGSSSETAMMDGVGFASPTAFTLTNFGPVFIGKRGAYLVLSNKDLQPVGVEIQPVLEALSSTQLLTINACFHDSKVKFGYTDVDAVHKEWWLEFRQEQGGIQKFWSGPHLLKNFTDQAVITSFGGVRDVRVSVLGANLYQRDSGYTNDTAAIAHKIIFNRLGLGADHFEKLLNWIYLAVKISQNETFTLTLDQEDGSAQSVVTKAATFATAARQLLQAAVVERSVGRVRSLTIENSSSAGHSIFDVSLLFKTQRRRLLR